MGRMKVKQPKLEQPKVFLVVQISAGLSPVSHCSSSLSVLNAQPENLRSLLSATNANLRSLLSATNANLRSLLLATNANLCPCQECLWPLQTPVTIVNGTYLHVVNM